MPLRIPLTAIIAKLETDNYSKIGTSGAAVAKLTKQTIPEMEKTITASAGDTILIHYACLLTGGPGNDFLLGVLPYNVEGFGDGGTPPTELEKITDGDNETHATTAVTPYGGDGPGALYYDTGEKATYTIYVKDGFWESGGFLARAEIYGSDDGETWESTGLNCTTGLSTEAHGEIEGVKNYRYFRLRLLKTNTGTAWHNVHTFNLWKGDVDAPPYLGIWPEVNGVELTLRWREYNLLDTPHMFSITRVYTIPADGEYTIAMKWQELPRAVGEDPYESFYQIPENERMLIIQHIKSIG